jgi:hypothetical protein
VVDGEIALREAPEHFFDSGRWAGYLELFATRGEALAELSNPEKSILGFYRLCLGENPQLHSHETQRYARLASLKRDLMKAFREELLSGQLIANGHASQLPERITVPAELWQDLWPDFTNNTARSTNYLFMYVRVSKAAAQPAPTASPLDEIVEWMRHLGEQGVDGRKELQRKVKTHFGKEIPARVFADAYKKAFQKPRGRPRKRQ